MKIAGHTMGTPELTVMEAIQLFSDIGLDAVEIIHQDGYKCGIQSNTTDFEVRKMKEFANEKSVEVSAIVSYSSDYNALENNKRKAAIEECTRCIHLAQLLKAPFVRIYGGTFLEGDTCFEEKRGVFVETMRKLSVVAEQASVNLVIENHFNTMTTGPEITYDIVSEINRRNVGILYDQANISFLSGEDFATSINIQKDKIFYVHVKDFVFKREGVKFKAESVTHVNEEERAIESKIVGCGSLPWKKIIGKLDEIGYDGYLSLEYERRWHPKDLPPAEYGMKESALFLKNIISKK